MAEYNKLVAVGSSDSFDLNKQKGLSFATQTWEEEVTLVFESEEGLPLTNLASTGILHWYYLVWLLIH